MAALICHEQMSLDLSPFSLSKRLCRERERGARDDRAKARGERAKEKEEKQEQMQVV